ncbi:ABC transporter substrate-binding protein [Nitrospinota bacterium]
MHFAPGLRGFFLVLNSRPGKPLADIRLRKAIAHAVNREALVKYILEGRGGVLNSPITPRVFGYNPNLKGYAYDPGKAKKLLAEAGYPGGKGLKLNLFGAAGSFINDREMVQTISDDLRRIGITINLKTMPAAGFRKYYMKYNEDVDINFFSNANNSADANYNLTLNFYSKGRGIYWNHPEVDRLIEQAAAESDRAKRKRLYLKAQEIIVDREAAHVFLYYPQDLYGVSRRVKFKARPDESVYIYDDVELAN